MAVFLGVVVAAGLGTSDFLGGFASRRSAPTAALLAMQVASLLAAGVLVAIDPAPSPSARVVAWSVLSGLGTAAGLACLYRALARGHMAVAAPVSAVGSGLVPMLWGILRHGERPGVTALAGAAIALSAVALIARDDAATAHHERTRPVDVVLAAGAGLGFGVSIVAFSEAGAEGSYWPILVARTAGVGAVLALVVARANAAEQAISWVRRLAPADRPYALAAGALEAFASAAFILAFRRGLTSVVAPVAALFPAATVLLARAVLHERIARLRAAGLFLALTGLVLIAL